MGEIGKESLPLRGARLVTKQKGDRKRKRLKQGHKQRLPHGIGNSHQQYAPETWKLQRG